jgi:hypothetical protein
MSGDLIEEEYIARAATGAIVFSWGAQHACDVNISMKGPVTEQENSDPIAANVLVISNIKNVCFGVKK